MWDELTQDMKVAVDTVFAPLSVHCCSDIEDSCIDYVPPFYLDDKACNPYDFRVFIESEPKYPLRCESNIYHGSFIVKSKDDWINHVDKFVKCSNEYRMLIAMIRKN